MKKLIFLVLPFILCIATNKGLAQDNASPSSNIALAVYIPQDMEGVNDSQKSKFQSKLMQLCSNTGFAATTDGEATLVIYPKFEVMEKSTVEGMENITTVKTEITLVIQNTFDNTVFSTYTKQIIGSGSSVNAAKDNAIMHLSPQDKDLQNFIAKGKQKILDYYNNKCGEILAKVESLVQTKQYEQAMSILFTVPVEATGCYGKVQTKLTAVFKLYSNQNCQQQLTQAKSLIANRSFTDALAVLSEIDPTSSCAGELKSLIQSTSTKVDAVDKREWDFKLHAFDTAADVEKARYNAVANVMAAYYKSRQLNVTVVR